MSSDQYGKKIRVGNGGMLDIYIALDVSDSIEENDFEKAKSVIKTLIEKVYEVNSMNTVTHFQLTKPFGCLFFDISAYVPLLAH